MARAYSIYEAKAKLSELLRVVKSGKEVVVSERGQPVAKIIPFKVEAGFKERWKQLCSAGMIVEASERPHFKEGNSDQEKTTGALSRFLRERD